MNQIAATMPEAKYRTTKKQVQPVRSIRTSEFVQELKALKPAKQQQQAKTEKSKSGLRVVSFWPVAVCLFLTGFAPEWQAMANQVGVWAMRFTFPYALLATHREIGIDAQMATVLPQMALYAQLPVDGVLATIMLARNKSLKATVGQLLLVHAVCAFVLWLITFSTK